MYNKRFLPGYIPPENNELLSSWIFRLSQEHKIKPQSFTKFYFNNESFWSRDVDKFIPKTVLKTILDITPLNIYEVKGLQLGSYSGIVFEGELTNSFTEGISNIGVYHRTRTVKGLLTCPRCLEKKAVYRKDWRLLSSIVCVECMCRLIEECPYCKSPIVFQRLEIGDKAIFKELPIYLCSNCRFDLRKHSIPVSGNSLCFEYQNYVNNLIRKGFGSNVKYSFFYFKILFLFLRRIKSSTKGKGRIRDGWLQEFDLEGEEFYSNRIATSLEFRFQNLPKIYSLLLDANNFSLFCKRHRIRYSDFQKDSEKLPYWFEKIFMEFF